MEELLLSRSCSLFRGMTETEAARLCACLGARRQRVRRGERIWLAGERVPCCGVVLRGRVRAERVSAAGRRDVTALHGPGAVFGDVLMASGQAKSPVDVFAAEETEVLLLPFAGVMGGCGKLCPGHELLRRNLLAEISEKFWALRRRIGYLTARSLRGRIALRLLDGAREAGSDVFSLGCTREELADLLAVNRSALSRELSRMRAAGLVEYRRDRFCILDREALAAWGDEGT